MEIQLVLGPNGSGKSIYAEELAVKSGGSRVYLATMVPQTPENKQRIEKHRIQRQDKGFMTIEKDWKIQEIPVNGETVVLLEDVSNLLSNGIFMHGADAKQTLEEILELAGRCKKVIAVSISGLSKEGYEEETRYYIEQLNWLNHRLKECASETVVMKNGTAESI